MAAHRYARGRHVTYSDRRVLGPNWSGEFVILEVLPSSDETPRYLIKSASESYSRVAFEHQLSAVLFCPRQVFTETDQLAWVTRPMKHLA
jgi:hypothetical protein